MMQNEPDFCSPPPHRPLCLWLPVLAVLASIGCGNRKSPEVDLTNKSWLEIRSLASGGEVRMAMWDGDPLINAYMRQYVQPKLKSEFEIRLEFVGLRGDQLVDQLRSEIDAGLEDGKIDLMWISGETFYQLREIDALYGPFTDMLPNSELLDRDNKYIAFDYQQPIQGFECPWGNVQFTLIYNSEKITNPPLDPDSLATWIKAHPGRFTFDTSFTGMTFLKSLLIHFAGGKGSLGGSFDEAKYERAADKLWEYIEEIRPYLWKSGKIFPQNVAELHRLFANNEVDFTMSNNDGEVDNKVLQGILPRSARGYALDTGTIRETHYLGIPRNSRNKAAAMVLANLLISPEAQREKAKPSVWGDGTVLDTAKLSPEWQDYFSSIPERTRVPSRDILEDRALMEPSPEVTIRLANDFQRVIIDGN